LPPVHRTALERRTVEVHQIAPVRQTALEHRIVVEQQKTEERRNSNPPQAMNVYWSQRHRLRYAHQAHAKVATIFVKDTMNLLLFKACEWHFAGFLVQTYHKFNIPLTPLLARWLDQTICKT